MKRKGAKMIIKCECGHDRFKIEKIPECHGCEFNGAWDETEYTYDEKTIIQKSLQRTEANEEGNCQLGENYNRGCEMYACGKCGEKLISPLF